MNFGRVWLWGCRDPGSSPQPRRSARNVGQGLVGAQPLPLRWLTRGVLSRTQRPACSQ